MERWSSVREGQAGEAVAARFLEAQGWKVLERNVRAGRREIDLIAARGGVVAFVEVKTRRGDGFGHPLEAITRRKQGEIAAVARAWLRDHPCPGQVLRFDAIAVHLRIGASPRVEHVEDAWRLG
jgi:putative endonuclease